MSYIVANINGFIYYLNILPGAPFMYRWEGLRQNGSLIYREHENQYLNLIKDCCIWPLEIVNA